jgi:hypothetical protein
VDAQRPQPPPGRWTVRRATPDGAEVEAVLDVPEPQVIVVRLDPRPEIDLWLEFSPDDPGYGVQLRERSSTLGERYGLPTFGEAVDAAHDLLRGSAPHGEWAVETLEALLGRAL